MKRVEIYPTTTYVIDEDARTVKAIIKNTKFDVMNILRKASREVADLTVDDSFLINSTYSATATCSDKDVFDVETGKKIARKKAIIKYNYAKNKKLKTVLSAFKTMVENLEDVIEYTDKKCKKFEKEIEKM